MTLDPLLTQVTTQFSQLTLDITTEQAAPFTQVHLNGLKELAALPDDVEMQIDFPREWYQATQSNLDALYQARIEHDNLATTISHIVATIYEFPTNYPLLQQMRITGHELYKIFGWSHLQKPAIRVKDDPNGSIAEALTKAIETKIAEMVSDLPDSVTIQFILRSNFYDLLRFIYTTSERCKALYPQSIHIPFSYHTIKNWATVAQFGVIAQHAKKNISVHFEFITEQTQEYFAVADSLQFVWGARDPVAFCNKERWLLDNLFKRVDVLERIPFQMEKLLDYLQVGYTPTTAALTLFRAEYAMNSDALRLLFQRRIAGKESDEAVNELFVIASILQEDCPRDFLEFALGFIEDSYRSKKIEALRLCLNGKLSLEQLFSAHEVFCRLKQTRPLCGILRTISPTFLEIDSQILKVISLTVSNEETLLAIPEDDCVELRARVKAAPYSLNKYLVALALAQSGTFEDMVEIALLHFPDMSADSPFKKQVFMGMHCLLQTLKLKIPAQVRTWTQFLLGTKNPLCKKVGFVRAKALEPTEIKKLIKTALTHDLPLALRLIEVVEEHANERDVKEWIQACRQKPLLLEVLTKNDNTRWIAACAKVLLLDTISWYRSQAYTKPQGAKRLVEIAAADHMEIVFQADTAQKAPEFFVEVLNQIGANPVILDKAAVQNLRTNFRLFREVVKDKPLAFLTLVKLYQEQCKDMPSNQVKKEVYLAYNSLKEIPESTRSWYKAFYPEEAVALESRVHQLAGAQKSRKEKPTQDSIDTDEFEKMIAGMAAQDGSLEAIDHSLSLRILTLVIEVIENGPKKYGKHASRLHDYFWNITCDDMDRKKIAWKLLTLATAVKDRAFFEKNAKLMDYALDGVTSVQPNPNGYGENDIVWPIKAFLEAAKQQYKNPFSVPAVFTLFKKFSTIDYTRELDQILFTYLARHYQVPELGYFAGLIMRKLEHNPADTEALKLACKLLDETEAVSRIYVLGKLSNPKLRELPQLLDAACRNYTRIIASCLQDANPGISEAALNLDRAISSEFPREVMLKMRRDISSHQDVMTQHFVIYLAANGWNDQSCKFIEFLVDLSVNPLLAFGGEGQIQKCSILDTPYHVREHYPVDSKIEDFTRVCCPVLRTKKRTSELLVGEKAHAQLLTALIMQGSTYNRDVQGNQRACLLNSLAFTLGHLIDSYPYYAQVPRLLELFRYAVSEQDPLYLTHQKVMHTLLQLAKGRDIQFGAELAHFHAITSTHSYPKIEEVEKKIDFLLAKGTASLVEATLLDCFRQFFLWQQHTADIPLGDRSRVLKKIMELWGKYPKEETLGKMYFIAEAVMFPYKKPIDSSDLFVIDRFLEIFDQLAFVLDPRLATQSYMLVNGQTAAPIALLSYTLNLFENVTNSPLFAEHPETYRTIANKIMARIGPARKLSVGSCIAAIASFNRSVGISFGGILPVSEQIKLLREWAELLLKLPKPIGDKLLIQLGSAIVASQIVRQITEEELSTLQFFYSTLLSIEDGAVVGQVLDRQLQGLPFYPKTAKE